nr:hypothetical protein [Solemoviridae sp.]
MFIQLYTEFVHCPVQKTWTRALWDEVKDSLGNWKYQIAGVTALAVSGTYVWRKRYQIKTACGFKPKVNISAPITNSTLESIRANSEESKLIKPKCQFMIGDFSNGTFTGYGNGVRIGDHAVFPGHVWADCDSKTIAFYDRSLLQLTVDNVDLIDIDTDLVALKLTERQWSVLGTVKPRIAHEAHRQFASVMGVFGKGTTGNLTDDPSVFGKVNYAGTTKAGYSGSAYMVQGQLAGIHCHGGAVNGGYSASYVYVTLMHYAKEVPEDSEDFLRATIEKGVRLRVDGNWKDLDTVRIKKGHRYMIVQRSSYNSVVGDHDVDPNGDIVFKGRLRDTFSEKESAPSVSGNETNSGSGAASSSLENAPATYTARRLKLMSQLAKLSDDQWNALEKRMTSIVSTGPGATQAAKN